MSFTDLRQFIDFLEDEDRLEHVAEADWDLEIGGLTELMIRQDDPKALLFDDIPGHESGQRILTNTDITPLQWTAAMGFEPTDSKREAVIALKERSLGKSEMTEPTTVDDGPILENIHRDDEIDITQFPAPVWHEKDGGQYIGTADVVITRDPDTGRINAGTYRVQVHGPDTLTVYISPGKDGKIIENKYLDRDEPVPYAVSVGHPVDLFIAANERVPSDVNELAYLGGMRGDPLEVVEGEVTGLPIPAHSELVFEGFIYPEDDPVVEGPFGEGTGYYAGGEHTEMPVTIERVYHRDDPIVLGEPPIRPPGRVSHEIRTAAPLWEELEESGIPGIVEANSLPWGPGWLTAIAIEKGYGGHSVQVGHHAATGPASAYHGRYTVVVDDDIDVFNPDEVLWAMCSRVDPARDIQIEERTWSTSLDPTIPPKKRERGDLTNSRAIIDATRPYHYRDQYPAVNEVSDELAAELYADWSELFEGSN
jgi:4-hydroxy-3-polyprenylbenzoate decarboxylase